MGYDLLRSSDGRADTEITPSLALIGGTEMKRALVAFSSIVMCSMAAAQSDHACPVTTSEDPLAGAAIPGWYGTESLAVRFSDKAMIWPTTKPEALIAGRLEWRSSGFRPGSESNLKLLIENLQGRPVTARISGAQNAYMPSVQPGGTLTDSEADALKREMLVSLDRWRMLTGVDFPEPGCWRISADYLGQKLTFVIESVPASEWKSLFSQ